MAEAEYVPGGPILAHHLRINRGLTTSCAVCGGAEESLTTGCPGFLLYETVLELIMDGKLDYKGGFWIDPRRPIVAKTSEVTEELTVRITADHADYLTQARNELEQLSGGYHIEILTTKEVSA